jgi:carbon-monoxide dehydrogenase small subunit
MAEQHDLAFTLNGRPVAATVEARLNLADFLRHTLRLTGTHVGCEHGLCGACNVMIDGRSVRSCLMLAVQADATSIETIEGMTERGVIAELQREFVARNALQCGYCTSGMLVTAAELLARGKPSRGQIREALSGNFCRCTGYQAIVDAIEAVAGRTP